MRDDSWIEDQLDDEEENMSREDPYWVMNEAEPQNVPPSATVPSPAVVDLAKTAAVAAKKPRAVTPSTPTPAPAAADLPAPSSPEAPPKDYGAGYDKMVGEYAEDPKRAELRNYKMGIGDRIATFLAADASGNPGAALGNVKAEESRKREGDVAAYDSARKQKLDDYMNRKKFGKDTANADKTSLESVAAQDLMAALVPDKDWKQYSAEQLAPMIDEYQKKYGIDEKLAATKAWRATQQETRADAAKTKLEADDIKRTNDAILTAGSFKRIGAGGQFMMANKRALITEDGLRVIEAVKRGDLDPTTQIDAELAAVIATSMMGGNQPAQETMEHFQAPTAIRTWAGIKQYASSKTQKAISPSILAQTEHQLLGQNTFWKQKRDNSIASLGITLEDVWKRNPNEKDRFFRAMDANFKEHEYSPLKAGGGKEPTLGTQKQAKNGEMHIFLEDPETGERGWAPMSEAVRPKKRIDTETFPRGKIQ
jgi:hypothetical protein